MTARCDDPLTDDDLLDYWTDAIAAPDAERIEEHLFSCDACAARLSAMSSLGAGLAALVRRGRVSGVISRSLLNRMQRDGAHVRMYTLTPGERVPCAAFPGDDLLVLSLRANFAGSDRVSVSLSQSDGTVLEQADDVPVARTDFEILWASPGASIRQLPSNRVRLRVTSHAPGSPVLAEYELDHTAQPS
jgi:hypothetical protein